MSQNIRQMIREILAQELAQIKSADTASNRSKIREESVSINSDRDLQAFVRRILHLCSEQQARSELQSGQLVFRLDQSGGSVAPVTSGISSGNSMKIEQGLVTERQIRNLPDGVSLLELGKSVRITPLASDAARQVGINIKQVKL